MLGRLRMPLPEAIKAYTQLVEKVLPEKEIMDMGGSAAYKRVRLREALKSIVRDATGNEGEGIEERSIGANQSKT